MSLYAQVVTSDGTLSTNVTSNDNLNFTITNGNRPNNGSNLFHSFSQFSIPTGGSAVFLNPTDVQNIISRVTGGVSNIDGAIQSQGKANLFLINPSGIIFGPNAQLKIGGSFIGSTASSLKFADGTEFRATDASTASPLLTVSAPSGLNFESNARSITVQGSGHGLSNGASISPLVSGQVSGQTFGLQVQLGQTLALIGGEIEIVGGIVAAPGGHIEIGSIDLGGVSFKVSDRGLTFDYKDVQRFGDIHLAQQALLDVSGIGNGSIQIQGGGLKFLDGSLVLIENIGEQASGSIEVNAVKSIELNGATPNGSLSSSLRTTALNQGKGGNIIVVTPRLLLHDGGEIETFTHDRGTAGNIFVQASESVEVFRTVPYQPRSLSIIDSQSYGVGSAGNITIETGQLTALGGGTIGSLAFGQGDAGNVILNAVDLVQVFGVEPQLLSPSVLTSASLNSGNAGNLIVNTRRLVVRDGGRIDSSTGASGASGNVTVNASESVEVSGTVFGSRNPSLIISSANIVDASLRAALGLPDSPTGASGNVIVNTPKLTVTDGALVTVKNDGTGNGGTLRVNAGEVFLARQGGITAVTGVGEGGNINLQVGKFLVLRQGGLISSAAGGFGDGGNITINAPFIVGVSSENSDIIANAFQGRGGNIDITTQGLFGLKFRPELTPENDISASSQFGLSGTVNISNLAFTPTAGLIQLPSNIDDPSQRIVQGCRTYGNSRFVATGRGGLPDDPIDRRNSPHPWTDLRDPSAFRNSATLTTASQANTNTPPIVEATGWRINAKGTVDIYATGSEPSTSAFSLTNCAGISASNL